MAEEVGGGDFVEGCWAGDAGGDAGFGGDAEGFDELVEEGFKTGGELFGAGSANAGEDDDEFVSAGAEGHVVFADGGANELTPVAEELVADVVAEGVVKGFEIVEVHEHDAKGHSLGAGFVENLGELFVEEASVVEAGECVAPGLGLPGGDFSFEMIGAVADAFVEFVVEMGLGFFLAAEFVEDVLDVACERAERAVEFVEDGDGDLAVEDLDEMLAHAIDGFDPAMVMSAGESPGEGDGGQAECDLHDGQGCPAGEVVDADAPEEGDAGDAGDDGD